MIDGDKIKSLRLIAGLNQREFGIILGYRAKNADQMVYDLESGRRGRKVPPHLNSLFIMLKNHGVESLRPFIDEKIKEFESEESA